MATKIKFGDYVTTTPYNHRGRVYGLRMLTNDDQEWVDAQTVRPTIQQLQGLWVEILVHDGGAVLVSIDRCKKIPAIKGFKHIYTKEYFK